MSPYRIRGDFGTIIDAGRFMLDVALLIPFGGRKCLKVNFSCDVNH